MQRDHELWTFVADKLRGGRQVSLLIVAESRGSSPGRAGYKMAIADDGQLNGSIGGGLMEVKLVDAARRGDLADTAIDQVHRRNSPNASGMICSGEQTVIFKRLTLSDLGRVKEIVTAEEDALLEVTPRSLGISHDERSVPHFERTAADFLYVDKLACQSELCIIGGGHCSLALSELMSRLDFRIRIFDDRPDLNTLEKNRFADEVTIVEAYENLGDHVASGADRYVVVMTLGYASDEIVIRKLIDRDFKYFGVLGSKAKMSMLLRSLGDDGVDPARIAQIRTPIGLPINSHSPEEIAVSIAAEIIGVRNS